MTRLHEIYSIEAYNIRELDVGHQPKVVKFAQLPPDAKKKWVDSWEIFFRKRSEKLVKAAELKDDKWRQSYIEQAERDRSAADDIKRNGESDPGFKDEEFFTDGIDAVMLWYDDRFAFFKSGQPEKRNVEKPDLIYFWDGETSEWYSDEDSPLGMRALKPGMEQTAIKLAQSVEFDPGVNPNVTQMK